MIYDDDVRSTKEVKWSQMVTCGAFWDNISRFEVADVVQAHMQLPPIRTERPKCSVSKDTWICRDWVPYHVEFQLQRVAVKTFYQAYASAISSYPMRTSEPICSRSLSTKQSGGNLHFVPWGQFKGRRQSKLPCCWLWYWRGCAMCRSTSAESWRESIWVAPH